MRNNFAESLYEQGKKNSKVCIVVADISPAGSMQKFREEFPDRFVNVGVAEQVMIGLAAGMALRGLRPFAYTIATFALYRPFEFVRDDLGYQNLPVTVVGIGGGVTYSTLGGTHHAMEDVAIASAIPNMTVLAPCDPAEVHAATAWCANADHGPVYLRLGKAGEPVLTADAVEPFAVGKVRTIRRGTGTCILTYGPIAKMAADVGKALESGGDSVTLASVHTLKPLDVDGIARLLHAHKRVVVIEEHVPHGGLASRVKEIAWDSGARTDLRCFTLKDEFIRVYGNQAELLAAHGLDARTILTQLGAK